MEKFFHLAERGTRVRTELLAGLTTFLTMAYITVVNPGVLAEAGMPFSGVLFATVLASALSSILMGLLANLPFALAPGMGINAFFTYTLVLGMGLDWQTALGAVFVSGAALTALSLTPVRVTIVRAVPASLRSAIAAGIGLFLALIGLESVGFVVRGEGTLLAFGGLSPAGGLFLFGLLLSVLLLRRRVPGALVLGIVATSLAAALVSRLGTAAGWLAEPLVNAPGGVFALPTLDAFLKLDVGGALRLALVAPIFALMFTDLFDSIATFLGVAQVAGLVDRRGEPLNVGRALVADSLATLISGPCGTSPATTYIESAAGVEEGGRTGLTAVTAGVLFLPFMFLSPVLALVPAAATAPVLVIVGVFMARPLTTLDWGNLEEAVPAFLAVALVPLTGSITQGIIWGFLTWTALKLLSGKAREVHWMLLVVDAFAILALVIG